uniref:Uncharacterized protein n=1 Tax=Glossina morsitans morsitans TaxID=37546 RepID=A0A1B0FNS7_GLOMM
MYNAIAIANKTSFIFRDTLACIYDERAGFFTVACANKDDFYGIWLKDVKFMADRIIGLTTLLKENEKCEMQKGVQQLLNNFLMTDNLDIKMELIRSRML